MEVYLIQHAQAKSSEEDPARPLAEAGEAAARRVAGHAARTGVKIERIYHSGRLRAQQTAEILANALGVERIEAKAGLNPSDDVAPVKEWLDELAAEGARSLAIVGHLPFLDKLASLLVAGSAEAQVATFQNAGIVKLIPKPSGTGYCVHWILTPDLAQPSPD